MDRLFDRADDGRSLTLAGVLAGMERRLDRGGVAGARSEAEALVCGVLGLRRAVVHAAPERGLRLGEQHLLAAALGRRLRREPLAYITGEKEFWSMPFLVREGVFIPRPETEHLVEAALETLAETHPVDPGGRKLVWDLCTGSGNVAIALAKESREEISLIGSDSSAEALAVAARNAERLGSGRRVRFFGGDLFSAYGTAAGRFDLIVSNPPYVPAEEIGGLEREIAANEPRQALDGGPDGLQVIRRIVSGAPRVLRPGGNLLLEIGAGQRAAVEALAAEERAYGRPRFWKDYSGYDRVVGLRLVSPRSPRL